MSINGISMEEMKEKWKAQEEWEKAHPVKAFVYGIPAFFRYVIPRHANDLRYNVKWGFQRMFREYDDPYIWSFYHEHNRITLAALKKLREIKHGSPWTDDPKGVLSTKGDINVIDDSYHERWDEALGLMIRGFEAQAEMDEVHILDKDGKYDHKATQKKCKELQKEWEKGMTLFVANYRGLWD